ncbi:hypothetical protein ACFRGK_21130 [Bacillus subtilis]
MIIHHIKVSSDVFDVLLTKVLEIQLAENDYRVGDKLFIRVNQTVIEHSFLCSI